VAVVTRRRGRFLRLSRFLNGKRNTGAVDQGTGKARAQRKAQLRTGMANEPLERTQAVTSMAMLLAAEFTVLGRLSRQQRRIVRRWLRELDTMGETGAQARTARSCRVSKWRVCRAVRRYRRIVAGLDEAG